MEKEQAKIAIDQAYTTILEKLEAQGVLNTREFIDFLHDIAEGIIEDDSHRIDLHSPEYTFEKEYKEIAEISLHSFSQTTESINELSSALDTNLVDLDALQNKFKDFQVQVDNELANANKTIKDLNKQISTLEHTSNLDPLTKVYNRRALNSYLETLLSKTKRQLQLRVLMIDINDFKITNDTSGHIAGDKVLVFIGKLLKHTIREGDKVFRYGGDEFAILMNRADKEAAYILFKRVNEGIKNNKLIYKGEVLDVSLSMGCTEHVLGDDFDTFIGRADKAMYDAKIAGKNNLISK